MTFTLRVPADEVEETESYSVVISGDSEESEQYRNREFEITPATATLGPQSAQDIQVLSSRDATVRQLSHSVHISNRHYLFHEIRNTEK